MIQFWKYEATGNDFIILAHAPADPVRSAQALCDRHFGLGADGLMYPEDSTVADVKMHYYNSDGSRARMCGNGLRCFVRFLKDEAKLQGSTVRVETDAGIMLATLYSAEVELELPLPVPLDELVSERRVDAYSLGMVPFLTQHAIVVDEPALNQSEVGPFLSRHPSFDEGINVNFVQVVSRQSLTVKTHERGAGWTLSCATGVAASALWAYHKGLIDATLSVTVPGGQLSLKLSSDVVVLRGPARLIARGTFVGEIA